MTSGQPYRQHQQPQPWQQPQFPAPAQNVRYPQQAPYPPQQQAPYAPPQQPFQQPFPPQPPPRRRRTGLWITVGVLAVVVTVGVGAVVGVTLAGRPAQGNAQDDGDPNTVKVTQEELKQAVEAHSKAFAAGDLKGYLRIFDQKNSRLIKEQSRTFQNLRKMPLDTADFAILDQQGLAQNNFGKGVTFSLDVAFVHRFAGIDLRPVPEWYRWTVTKAGRGAPLVVTKVGGAPSPLGDSRTVFYPAPWDLWPDVSVTKTRHTIVLAAPSQAAEARKLAATAEEAAAGDLDFWAENGDKTAEVPTGFVVALVRGKSQLGHLFRTAKGKVTESGISIGMPTFRGSGDQVKIGGSRVVVDTTSQFFEDTAGAKEIFRHEIAHSLVATLDSGDFDLLGQEHWIVEGFAEYVAHRGQGVEADRRTPETRAYVQGRLAQKFQGRIPDNLSWDLDGLTSVNYQLGHLAIQMIAEKYGEAKMVGFVAAHYRGKKADAAFREVLGVGEQEFERKWAQYVRGKLA
ncbi:hypothetical protein [Sphaerisporangium fuscum]|uniref:hypothetical protein n=1 Tax=Sphaerisporangium fuscum TaxID=2835868 RepID=UPI001BDD5BFC|nr:hypothetical protein [Sphaerisporangium fuscum]